MAAEAATKEKNLRSREQAVIDGENDLHVGEKTTQFKHTSMIVMYRCMRIISPNVAPIESES